MNNVIFIPGVGQDPIEQENLPELWLPFGLNVELQTIDWSGKDYLKRLERIGDRIIELSQTGSVSLVGASGGAKAVLSLFAVNPDMIHRAVTVSGKIQPYRLKPKTIQDYPNLAISSDTLPVYLSMINSEMLKRTLCICPFKDEVIDPSEAVLAGAQKYSVAAYEHIDGIKKALTVDAQVIADFILQQPNPV